MISIRNPRMTYDQAMSQATRFTAKYRNYAALYDLVSATLRPDPTILEIGIANGGSLQTWRKLCGEGARIIGVDLNPNARALADEGYEIHILDTGDERSWRVLHQQLSGAVDLLVDDGGHTNHQQISALVFGTELIRDGGWLVVEDLHASFMREFGNPSPYSTARFLAELAADLHRLHPRSDVTPKHVVLASSIEYMLTAGSWVGLRINRKRPSCGEEVVAGHDKTLMDYDHRWDAVEAGIGARVLNKLAPALSVRWSRFLSALAARRLFHRTPNAE